MTPFATYILFLGGLIPMTLKCHISSDNYQMYVSSPSLMSEPQTFISKHQLCIFTRVSCSRLTVSVSERALLAQLCSGACSWLGRFISINIAAIHPIT